MDSHSTCNIVLKPPIIYTYCRLLHETVWHIFVLGRIQVRWEFARIKSYSLHALLGKSRISYYQDNDGTVEQQYLEMKFRYIFLGIVGAEKYCMYLYSIWFWSLRALFSIDFRCRHNKRCSLLSLKYISLHDGHCNVRPVVFNKQKMYKGVL